MGRKCLVCSHARRKEIDKNITNNVAYRRISAQFGINDKAVGAHAKNHLKPLVEKAVKELGAAIKSDVIEARQNDAKYRDEVLLAPIEKVRLMQSRLLDDYDGADLSARLSIYREFRGYITEEAKMSGLYQKDAENEQDKVIKRLKSSIEKRAEEKNISYDQELKYYLEHFAADLPAAIKTELSSSLVN